MRLSTHYTLCDDVLDLVRVLLMPDSLLKQLRYCYASNRDPGVLKLRFHFAIRCCVATRALLVTFSVGPIYPTSSWSR